jgi:hypothetical protein
MPLTFWAAQTMAASDLLGATACRPTASAYCSPQAAAITIQTAYHKYYLSDRELCHQIASMLIFKQDKATWIPGWIIKDAWLNTAAFLIQDTWFNFLSRKLDNG